jgi:hypothetical protein
VATPIADMVQQMLSAGISAEIVISAIRAAEQHAQAVVASDIATAKRRAYDRERKRRKTAKPSAGNSVDAPIKKDPSLSNLEFDEERKEEGVVIARARAKPATRLPDDWTLSKVDLDFARTLLPEDRIVTEFERFRDYWHARAGPGAVKRDWSATWRNWCRKAAEGGVQNGQHRNGGGANRSFGFSGLAAHIRARQASRSL